VNIDIGANASAEEENEEYSSSVRTVNNIVDSFRLQETSFDTTREWKQRLMYTTKSRSKI